MIERNERKKEREGEGKRWRKGGRKIMREGGRKGGSEFSKCLRMNHKTVLEKYQKVYAALNSTNKSTFLYSAQAHCTCMYMYSNSSN